MRKLHNAHLFKISICAGEQLAQLNVGASVGKAVGKAVEMKACAGEGGRRKMPTPRTKRATERWKSLGRPSSDKILF